MSETKTIVQAVEQPKQKLDLSDIPPAERARLQKLRAEVMIQRGLRDHCDWLAKNGGLSKKQTAADAAIAMEVGSNLGFPLGVARTAVVVINGTPTVYGDSALALIRASGLVDPKKGGYIRSWYTGKVNEDGSVGDDYTAHVGAKRADTGEEDEATFSVAEAKRAGLWGGDIWRIWGRKRMLRYRALGFIARDLFSDITKGLHIREELVGGPDDTGEPPAKPSMTQPAADVPPDPLWAEPAGEVVSGELYTRGSAPACSCPSADVKSPSCPVHGIVEGRDNPDVKAEPGVVEGEVVLHEPDKPAVVEGEVVLHAAEGTKPLMPPEVQEKIAARFAARAQNKPKAEGLFERRAVEALDAAAVVQAAAQLKTSPYPAERALAAAVEKATPGKAPAQVQGDLFTKANGETVRVLERDDKGKPVVVERAKAPVAAPAPAPQPPAKTGDKDVDAVRAAVAQARAKAAGAGGKKSVDF